MSKLLPENIERQLLKWLRRLIAGGNAPVLFFRHETVEDGLPSITVKNQRMLSKPDAQTWARKLGVSHQRMVDHCIQRGWMDPDLDRPRSGPPRYKINVHAIELAGGKRPESRQDEEPSIVDLPVADRGGKKLYLGITVDKRRKEVSREGYPLVSLRLSKTEWHIFVAALAGRERGASREKLKDGYPGDLDGDGLKSAKYRLKQLLHPLDLTLARGSGARILETGGKNLSPDCRLQ